MTNCPRCWKEIDLHDLKQAHMCRPYSVPSEPTSEDIRDLQDIVGSEDGPTKTIEEVREENDKREEKLTSQEADPAADWMRKAFDLYMGIFNGSTPTTAPEAFEKAIRYYMPKEERKPIITEQIEFCAWEITRMIHKRKETNCWGNMNDEILDMLETYLIEGDTTPREEETLSEGTPKETYEQYTKRHENLYSDIKSEGTAETSHGGTSKKSLLVGSIPTMQKNSLTKKVEKIMKEIRSRNSQQEEISRTGGKRKSEEVIMEEVLTENLVGETGEETTITKEDVDDAYKKGRMQGYKDAMREVGSDE